jgi:hypothetical protein
VRLLQTISRPDQNVRTQVARCCNLANRPRPTTTTSLGSLARFRPHRMPPSPSAHVVSILHPLPPSLPPLAPVPRVKSPASASSVTVILQTPGLMGANPSTEVKDESVSVALRYNRQAETQLVLDTTTTTSVCLVIRKGGCQGAGWMKQLLLMPCRNECQLRVSWL